MKSIIDTVSTVILFLVGLIVALGPYFNHLYVTFTDEKYILLLVGALIPPIGWIHGLGAFFGWWS